MRAMSRRETLAFFRRYRTAFNRLDGDAVAALWHTPSSIADSAADGTHARVTHWHGEAPMRDNMRALCSGYRAAGYHRAEFELLGHLPLGRDQSFAQLRWTLKRRDGSTLQRFGTGYHLVRSADGVRVLAAAAYQENIRQMKGPNHAAE
jgi:hypothetical protein